MANLSALTTLIDLASKDSDNAAKKLGQALRMAEDTEQKLNLLLNYRDEYAARFQTSMTAGLTAVDYRNFRHFIEKLDAAIEGQQSIVMAAKHQTEIERKSWQDCERKRMSYDTLASRAEKQLQQQENKRDQKQTDEHAARAAMHKR
ncbi:MAG: flagellar export protein FliJ [Proteobacteria bacterium]|nr:flagellar export protein FliJ [Pseudomonadota bacterium]